MSTLEHVLRVCQDHVDASERYTALVDDRGQIRRIEDMTQEEAWQARSAAHRAWRAREDALKTVRELSPAEILSAIAEASSTHAGPVKRGRMTAEEEQRVVHLHDQGLTQAAIGRALGRRPSGVARVLRRRHTEGGKP